MNDTALLVVGLFVALIFGVLAIVCGCLNAAARDEDREPWEPGYRGKDTNPARLAAEVYKRNKGDREAGLAEYLRRMRERD